MILIPEKCGDRCMGYSLIDDCNKYTEIKKELDNCGLNIKNRIGYILSIIFECFDLNMEDEVFNWTLGYDDEEELPYVVKQINRMDELWGTDKHISVEINFKKTRRYLQIGNYYYSRQIPMSFIHMADDNIRKHIQNQQLEELEQQALRTKKRKMSVAEKK